MKKKSGRPPKKDRNDLIRKLKKEGKTYLELADIFKISPGSIHEVLYGRVDKGTREKPFRSYKKRIRDLSTAKV